MPRPSGSRSAQPDLGREGRPPHDGKQPTATPPLARLALAVVLEVAEWQAPLLLLAIRLRGRVY